MISIDYKPITPGDFFVRFDLNNNKALKGLKSPVLIKNNDGKIMGAVLPPDRRDSLETFVELQQVNDINVCLQNIEASCFNQSGEKSETLSKYVLNENLIIRYGQNPDKKDGHISFYYLPTAAFLALLEEDALRLDKDKAFQAAVNNMKKDFKYFSQKEENNGLDPAKKIYSHSEVTRKNATPNNLGVDSVAFFYQKQGVVSNDSKQRDVISGFLVMNDLLERCKSFLGRKRNPTTMGKIQMNFSKDFFSEIGSETCIIPIKKHHFSFVAPAAMLRLHLENPQENILSEEFVSNIQNALEQLGLAKTPSDAPRKKQKEDPVQQELENEPFPKFKEIKEKLIGAFRGAVYDGESSEVILNEKLGIKLVVSVDLDLIEAFHDAAAFNFGESKSDLNIKTDSQKNVGRERSASMVKIYNALVSQTTEQALLFDSHTNKSLLFTIENLTPSVA